MYNKSKNYTEGISEGKEDAKYRRLKYTEDTTRKASYLELEYQDSEKKKMSRDNVREDNG